MLMKSQPILNKRIQNKITVIERLSFIGIGNKTFSLSSSDLRWTVADSKTQFLANVLNYRYYYLVHYCHNCQLRVLVC